MSGAPASRSRNSGATVNYDPVGSGTGRENFISGAFSFAGSDSALSTDEGELDAAKERCGGDVIEVPAYISPIAVIFNLPGVDELNLKPETIAQIFDGKIAKWNDDGHRRRQPGRRPAGHGDHPGAPLRRLRHDRQLHRLPVQGGRRRLVLRPGRRLADPGW